MLLEAALRWSSAASCQTASSSGTASCPSAVLSADACRFGKASSIPQLTLLINAFSGSIVALFSYSVKKKILLVSSTALFVLLSASAGTWIIGINLLLFDDSARFLLL